VSCNSSHLRASSINFSFTPQDNNRQHSLRPDTRSVLEETLDCSHYQNRAGTDRSGPVPSRQTFSLGGVTELRRDGDVPVTVNISVSLRAHEKILLNGDISRRNGNVTYSVNRPLVSNAARLRAERTGVRILLGGGPVLGPTRPLR
jgi:hypothetical protein